MVARQQILETEVRDARHGIIQSGPTACLNWPACDPICWVLFILTAVPKHTNNNQSVILSNSTSAWQIIAWTALFKTSTVESHWMKAISRNEKMQKPVKNVAFKGRPQLMQFLCKLHKVWGGKKWQIIDGRQRSWGAGGIAPCLHILRGWPAPANPRRGHLEDNYAFCKL